MSPELNAIGDPAPTRSGANVALALSNRPESVELVHEALQGVAAVLALDALEANGLDTAVSEVCKNVVYHAYDGAEGPLEVDVHLLPGEVEVAVRDRGIGIRPLVGERTLPHTGIGLPIVHALTQRLVFSKLEDGGTEVRMLFTTPEAAPLEEPGQGRWVWEPMASDQALAMALAPAAMARAVLPRVAAAVATQSGFVPERVSELRRMASMLAEQSPGRLLDGLLCVTIQPDARGLELRLSPLRAGSAAGLLEQRFAAGEMSFAGLSEESRMGTSQAAETLVLRLNR